jgi:spermidine/putrescine transport system substrate-binding protein
VKHRRSTVVTACALLLLSAGCQRPERVLHLYTWADYVKPELLQRFEAEQGCRVVVDTFDSNESMYAKLKAGAGGYDVITPSSYMVSVMHGQGMLRDLDHVRLPNLANVDREYLELALDPGMRFSVPYMLTTTGLGYLKSRVDFFEPTWAMFDRTDLAGRMTMLDDMRETLGAGLKSLGYSLNTTDPAQLEQARDVVIRWKRNLAKLENEQYKTGVASGEFVLVHGYSGDLFQVQAENEDIAFAVPREGTSLSCDDLVIPADARELELAHAFVNFLHDPRVAAENTDFIQYLCPNAASYPLLSEEIRSNPAIFLGPELRAKCEVIADLGEHNALYSRTWDQVKAAK